MAVQPVLMLPRDSGGAVAGLWWQICCAMAYRADAHKSYEVNYRMKTLSSFFCRVLVANLLRNGVSGGCTQIIWSQLSYEDAIFIFSCLHKTPTEYWIIGTFHWEIVSLIPAWICNYIRCNVWDEVWNWISDFISHFTGWHAITYPYWD